MPLRVLHLGGNRLGERVLGVLQGSEDEVRSTSDLSSAIELLKAERFDWIVSAGFRHFVPAGALALAPEACNVHTSLLPWGRGANPNVWMLAMGEPAGITIHKMTRDLDGGDIYSQRTIEVTLGDTAKTLYYHLEDAAVSLFEEVWPSMRNGELRPYPQPSGGSFHMSSELSALADIDLDSATTWRKALDTLRALTFPPHRNLVLEEDGRRYSIEIRIGEVPELDRTNRAPTQ